jgi:PAS domain S-box-containing protein
MGNSEEKETDSEPNRGTGLDRGGGGGGGTAASAQNPGALLGDMARMLFTGAAVPNKTENASLAVPPPPNVRMAEAKYRRLIELLPAVTFMASFDEGLSDLYVSPQIETLLGYTQKEWLEDPVLWYQRLHPDDRARWNMEFARTVAAGEPLKAVYRFTSRDHRTVWIHCEAKIVRDEQNRPSFIHGIGVDVSPIKIAEQRVLEYSRKLEDTNRELEKFAYVASHDLQEPLRSILAYSGILTEDCAKELSPEASAYLERIVKAGERMKSLIHALLEFSRVGRDDLPFTATDFNESAREALGNLHGAAERSKAEIMVEPLPVVRAIRPYITTLFQNLVGNAIKYASDKPPKIAISGIRSNENWVFSVSDNGPGIAPQHQNRIFEIFQRLQPHSKIPGTGIGLAICKKVVDLHGGRIWVESEPGKGSTFKFAIPVEPTNGKS